MDLWDTFVELVIRHFAFLETDFDFKCQEPTPPFVYFISSRIKVFLHYDQLHHELELGVRQIDDPSTKHIITIGMLMFLAGDPMAHKSRSPRPSNARDLSIEVLRMADQLKKYGLAILQGDESDFERLDQIEKEFENEINQRAKQNLMRFRKDK
jgi:hypothetical protein